MTLNRSLSGAELELAFGQLYMNATFQVPLPKILCFDYDCQTQTDTFFVIDNSHCFNHIPTEAIQNKFIAEGGGEGLCHKHVRRSPGKHLTV